MFHRNELVDNGLAYLQRVNPHHSFQRVLLIFVLAIATIPTWITFARIGAWGPCLIPIIAMLTLSLYWLFQVWIMQSAIHLTGYAWLKGTSDLVVGNISRKAANIAAVRAVLQHQRWYIVSASLALTSLSLVITTYNYFWTDDRGLLRYVGVVRSGYYGVVMVRYQDTYPIRFPFLEWPATLLLAVVMLLIFTFVNSLLSASLALWTMRLRRTLALRSLIVFLTFLMFLALFWLRNTPEWTCHRTWMIPSKCADMLFRMRVVDSLQASLLSFADGGAALVTGTHLPMGADPQWEWYQWRHLLVGMVTYLCQLALSGYFLWLASHSSHGTGVTTSER
jgi:hypothetical protein